MADASVAIEGHHETNTGISNNKMAMWLFLASDCLLFGALISTFLLYRTNISDNTPFTSPSDVFDIPFTSFSSFVLLMRLSRLMLLIAVPNRAYEMP